MIFRLTQSLNTRLKAGKLEALPLRENPLLDWSAHLFSVGRRPFILLSNTASLLSAVASAHGITNQFQFRALAFDSIRRCVESQGVGPGSRAIAPADGDPVRFAKTLNRSVSGSMNELVRLAELLLAEGELTLPEIGRRLNDTLLSALATGESHGYGKPGEAFRALVGGAGASVESRPTADDH